MQWNWATTVRSHSVSWITCGHATRSQHKQIPPVPGPTRQQSWPLLLHRVGSRRPAFLTVHSLSFFLLYYFIIHSFYCFSFHAVINLYLIRKYIFKGLCLCVFFHTLSMVFFTHILWSLPFSFSPNQCFLLSSSPPSLSLPSSVTWRKKNSFSIPFKIFVVHFISARFFLSVWYSWSLSLSSSCYVQGCTFI